MGIVDRFGRLRGGTRGKRLVPRRELWMIVAPWLRREPKVHVGQRTSYSNVTDRKRRRAQRFRFVFERGETGLPPRRETCEMNLGRILPLALATPQNQKVQHSIAQCLAPQRRPARLKLSRKKFRPRVQRVEIFADGAANRTAACRRPTQAPEFSTADYPSSIPNAAWWPLPPTAHNRDVHNARFMGDDHDFTHKRRTRRPMQFHDIPVVSPHAAVMHVCEPRKGTDTMLSGHLALRFAHAYVPRHASENIRYPGRKY